MASRTVDVKRELEEVLYRLAWKWAVLAYYAGLVSQHRELPKELIDEISNTKSILDSGCYSACELITRLRQIEKNIFPYVLELGVSEASRFMEMLSKAMSGQLTKEDINLEVAKPILSDCSFPCMCDRKFFESIER